MLREPFIGPGLKAVRTLVIRPLQGYGNAAPLSYPDTWVRKPDCLPLPGRGFCGLLVGGGAVSVRSLADQI